jgi:F-type H+-transporting ATPase subunit delta
VPDQVVSSRYAEALMGAITDPGTLETVHEELSAIAGIVGENGQLRAFLEGPSIVEEHKHALVDKTFRDRVHHLTLDFLHLLLHKHRIDHLVDIAIEFGRLVEAKRNQVRVKVSTAVEVPIDQLDRLKRALDVSIGKDCILETRIDPRVLGGVVAVVGDRVIDGSLRSALDHLRKELMSAPLRS